MDDEGQTIGPYWLFPNFPSIFTLHPALPSLMSQKAQLNGLAHSGFLVFRLLTGSANVLPGQQRSGTYLFLFLTLLLLDDLQ